MARRRVAVLLPDLKAGGAQQVMLMLAKSFVEKECDVDVVVGVGGGELIKKVPPEANHYILRKEASVFGENGLAASMMIGLIFYLYRRRPDVVFSTMTGTNLLAVIARRVSGSDAELILREACQLKNLRGWRGRLYSFMMRILYPLADKIVVLTPEMKCELTTALGLSDETLVSIPNPVDIYKIQSEARISLPDNFDAGTPYLLAVGRLSVQKDYMTMIDAYSKIACVTNVRLIILGEGPERPKLEDRINKLGLSDKIELRGYDSNPYRWMAHAEMLVLSSRWEGYPNVLAEAEVFGLPLVATEYSSSVRELVMPPGSVVAVGNADDMADAIMRVMQGEKINPSADMEDVVRDKSERAIRMYHDLV